MIANSAFLAALTTFVIAAWLAAELTFLAPYKAAIFRAYGVHLAGATVVLFLNLCGAYYMVARWLFLRDAGRKLTHIDRQLRSASGLHDELRQVPSEEAAVETCPSWTILDGTIRAKVRVGEEAAAQTGILVRWTRWTPVTHSRRVWIFHADSTGNPCGLTMSATISAAQRYERWRLSGHSA